ncbi:MAG: Spy/CpxP family protein refolding chaperone [Gammaproteobacteria bacterium]
MNKTILTLALAFTLPLTVTAVAQPRGPAGDQPSEWHRGQRIEHLTQELDLTPEQKTKVEALFKEQHEKFQAVREETQTKLKVILTPEYPPLAPMRRPYFQA